jgi:two-component system alkaline phosphatase synthesis response regulator PhoP
MSRILVIEDNDDLAFGLRNNLEIEGHEVEVAADGSEGLSRARRGRADLVILDLMLPGTDGFRLLRTLRQEGSPVPILILTARGEEADKVRGLKLGADDYVTKPFGLLELLARVEALLRRGRHADEIAPRAAIERFGDVEIDCATRSVSKGSSPVELAPKEYDLLLALVRRRGAVGSRLDLMREVWGYADAVITRTIDTHVAELRRKLEADPGSPRHILTVRKVGYRLRL